MNGIYLSTPYYCHGPLQDIKHLPILRQDKNLHETLMALGLNSFSAVSVNELTEMAVACVAKMLDANQLAPAEVDALVYPSTCYFMGDDCNDPNWPTSLVGDVIEALEMPQVIPYGVSFSRCVNSINAIELASGLISRGAAKNVLVMVADCMQGNFPRVVDPGISVVSDVASCALMSSTAFSKPCFRVDAIESHVDWDLAKITAQANFPDYLRKTVGGMEAVKSKIFSRMEHTEKDYIQLITNTVNNSVVRIFSQATGLSAERIFSRNVGTLGHCDGSDILVNLCDFADVSASEIANTSKSILAIANGPFMWGGLSLTPIN